MKKLLNKAPLKKLLLLFLFFRLFDFIIVVVARYTIPFESSFPYKKELLAMKLPFWISAFANFDGMHYLNIARFGYQNYEQAFFPLLPLVIHIVNFVLSNVVIAGLLVSSLFFFLGMTFFYLFLKNYLSDKFAFNSVFFLILFPTSFFFNSIYTESLFLFLSMSTLFFTKNRKYSAAFILALLAGMSRNTGVFLVIPMLFLIYENKEHKNLKALFAIPGPIIGLGLYSLYLLKTVGDPFYFYHIQPLFGANRASEIVLLPQVLFRYLKIILSANFNITYFIAMVELSSLIFMLICLILYGKKIFENKSKRWAEVGLIIFSTLVILIPTLTGTLTSLPRYSLLSYSVFIYISLIQSKTVKILLTTFFVLLHLVLLSFFSRGFFIS